jgi:hypothetical protein
MRDNLPVHASIFATLPQQRCHTAECLRCRLPARATRVRTFVQLVSGLDIDPLPRTPGRGDEGLGATAAGKFEGWLDSASRRAAAHVRGLMTPYPDSSDYEWYTTQYTPPARAVMGAAELPGCQGCPVLVLRAAESPRPCVIEAPVRAAYSREGAATPHSGAVTAAAGP